MRNKIVIGVFHIKKKKKTFIPKKKKTFLNKTIKQYIGILAIKYDTKTRR